MDLSLPSLSQSLFYVESLIDTAYTRYTYNHMLCVPSSCLLFVFKRICYLFHPVRRRDEAHVGATTHHEPQSPRLVGDLERVSGVCVSEKWIHERGCAVCGREREGARARARASVRAYVHLCVRMKGRRISCSTRIKKGVANRHNTKRHVPRRYSMQSSSTRLSSLSKPFNTPSTSRPPCTRDRRETEGKRGGGRYGHCGEPCAEEQGGVVVVVVVVAVGVDTQTPQRLHPTRLCT
jgi:hypothetical protein